jgi:hypothetical protein
MAEIAPSRRGPLPDGDGELWQALVTEGGRTVIAEARVSGEVVAWAAERDETPESVVRDRIARELSRLGPEGPDRLTHLERAAPLEIGTADL